MSNIGEVQNTGVELSLNSTNIRMDKLTWRTSFSLAYNKNKITHLYGIMEDVKDADGNVIGQREADDIKNKRFIGHDIDEIWDYKVVLQFLSNGYIIYYNLKGLKDTIRRYEDSGR